MATVAALKIGLTVAFIGLGFLRGRLLFFLVTSVEGVDGESRPFDVLGFGLDHSLLELLGLGLIAGLIAFVVAALTSSQVGSCVKLI